MLLGQKQAKISEQMHRLRDGFREAARRLGKRVIEHLEDPYGRTKAKALLLRARELKEVAAQCAKNGDPLLEGMFRLEEAKAIGSVAAINPTYDKMFAADHLDTSKNAHGKMEEGMRKLFDNDGRPTPEEIGQISFGRGKMPAALLKLPLTDSVGQSEIPAVLKLEKREATTKIE